MFDAIKKACKHLVTEPDNQTFCPVRVIALLGSFEYLGVSAHNYFAHQVFDPQSFAIGFGALIGGAGVALGLKKDTPKEP